MEEWSFSAVEAGEPEERAADEKEVVEKEGERNAERMGSEAMESSAVAAAAEGEEVIGLLKVERRWRGEEDLWSGDAGEAIFELAKWFYRFLPDWGQRYIYLYLYLYQ